MSNRAHMISQLQNQMQTNGFSPKDLDLSGEFQRFSRDGSNKTNCWFVAREFQLSQGNTYIGASYGDWKTDEMYSFSSFSGFTELEKTEAKVKAEEFKKEVETKKNELRENAKLKSQDIYYKAKHASNHAYLERKKIPNILGIKQSGNLLIIPMYDVEGVLVGLQRITTEGDKFFLKGQQVKGAFFVIGAPATMEDLKYAYIAEGFATAASIFLAEKKPVVCVFNAGNISAVCSSLKMKNKFIRLTICADNDRHTEGNPGLSKATAAAKAHNARLVYPEFKDEDSRDSDFNDVHVKDGLPQVKFQLKKAQFLKEEKSIANHLAEEYLISNSLIAGSLPLLRCYQSEFFQYKNSKYHQVPDSDMLGRTMAFLQDGSGVKMQSTSKLAADVLANLKGLGHLDSSQPMPSWLNDRPEDVSKFISVMNGIINLEKFLKNETEFLESHDPNFFSTVCIPVVYNPEAKCPDWERFLMEVLPDLSDRRMLRQWFGYNLTTDVSFHKFLIMIGEGANGKSVVCNALNSLVGKENISSVGLEAFNPNRTFPLAHTVGKLANVVSELNSTSVVAEGELKKFVTGDSMSAERKFKNPFTFTPTAKLTFATNELPEFKDPTNGLQRRILILPFNVQIPSEKQNKNLAKPGFWEKHPDLPGIFNWALEGLKDLHTSNGFIESCESIRRKQEYIMESNPTRQFLEDTYEESLGDSVSCFDLTQSYEKYMKMHGHEKLRPQRLKQEVRRVFQNVKYTEHARMRPTQEVMANGGPQKCRRYFNLKSKLPF